MQQIPVLFYIVFIIASNVNSQILYECNFDNATIADNCFVSGAILVQASSGTLNSQPPESPFSDVTASLKSTSNGEVCSLPYKVGSYQWDMYFCNSGFCPTLSSASSLCASGKFGLVRLTSNTIRSYPLKIPSGGINGIDKQCLIYYYYMSIGGQKSITIRKVEVDNKTEVIDSVISSPFNGWIRREVTYIATARGYKLYFDAQKTSSDAYAPYVVFDEISVYQGSCENETATTVSVDITSASTSVLQTTQTTSTTEKATTQTTSTTEKAATQTTSTTEKATTQTTSTTVKATTQTTSTTVKATTSHTTSYTTSFISTTRELSETSASISSLTTTTINSTALGILPEVTPANKTYIIVLATVIPVVSIVIVGIVVWMRMSSSSNILKNIFRPFTNLHHHDKSSPDLELDSVQDDGVF